MDKRFKNIKNLKNLLNITNNPEIGKKRVVFFKPLILCVALKVIEMFRELNFRGKIADYVNGRRDLLNYI